MNFGLVKGLLLLVAGLMLLGMVGGCSTDEPENASLRPWNTPQGWQGGMPLMNTQHE